MDSLGPALALPAYFDVSVRGRKRDLSTTPVDGASNRLGSHHAVTRDRVGDRDTPVRGHRVQRRPEIIREVGLDVSVRGRELDSPSGGYASDFGDDAAVGCARGRVASDARKLDLAVRGQERDPAVDVPDPDVAVRGVRFQRTPHPMDPDLAVGGRKGQAGLVWHLNEVVDLEGRDLAPKDVPDSDRLTALGKPAHDVDAPVPDLHVRPELLHEVFGLGLVLGPHAARDLDPDLVTGPALHGNTAVLVLDADLPARGERDEALGNATNLRRFRPALNPTQSADDEEPES